MIQSIPKLLTVSGVRNDVVHLCCWNGIESMLLKGIGAEWIAPKETYSVSSPLVVITSISCAGPVISFDSFSMALFTNAFTS
jgi:hypothetical protein